MPELPEVETIARMMQSGGKDAPAVIDRPISNAKILWHKTLAEPSQRAFKRRLVGSSITSVNRRGKYLLCQLPDASMLIHLRMSGEILVGRGKDMLGSHPRMVIHFEDGLHLSFSDARKFGRVWLVDDPQAILGKLGPEPLDESLTPALFTKNLLSRKRQIKPLLLDQTFLAGVGNIYADESLHLAKIHPLSTSNTLTAKQAKRLLNAVRNVLQKGIETNGASIDWVYRGGGYQNQFRVYGRAGETCHVCGSNIERTVVGQRGTYFCPKCQEFHTGNRE